MRQRLLLVAGWVLAAVGTSVVASAAVAATGGQVTDRALRPLTAAEVAALPEGSPEVLSESLASGDSSNTNLGRTGESDTLGATEQTPAGAEGDLFSGIDLDRDTGGPFLVAGREGPEPVLTEVPEVTEVTDLDPILNLAADIADTLIEHTDGGSVSLATTRDKITVLWATPRVGWQLEIDFVSPTQVVVSFTDAEVVWSVNAESIDGTITVVTQRIGLGPR